MFFTRDHVRKGDDQYRKGNLRKAAEHYLKGQRFRQAAKIYEELGEVAKAVEVYDRHGLAGEAAALLQDQGRTKEAIQRYEKAGEYRKAAEASLSIRSFVRAGRLFEQAEMFDRAAESFAKVGEIEHVVRAWERESKKLRGRRGDAPNPALDKKIREIDVHRAEILSNIGRHVEAANLLAEHGFSERAAPLLERAGRHAEAAREFLRAERIADALAAVERAGDDADDELRAEIYSNSARHSDAARLFEKMGRFDAAANAYEGDEKWAEAAELWERAEAPGRAAECYLRIDRFDQAGRCFAEDGRPEQAAEIFIRAGMDREAADAYRDAGRHLEAGRRYADAGDRAAAREALQAVPEDHAGYGPASLRLIPLLVEDGRVDEAQRRWQTLTSQGIALSTTEQLYVEGRIFEALGRYGEAEAQYQKVLAEEHGFRDAADRLRDVKGKLTPTGPFAATADRDAVNPITDTHTTVERALADETGGRSGTGRAEASRPDAGTGALAAAGDGPALSTFAEGSLPFVLDREIDSWWNGAAFFQATDRRSGREILLVSFPLAEVGSRVDGFRQAMREVAALRDPAILKLDEAIVAGDKVLLLYEPYSPRTLASRIADRRPAPSEALNLIGQICVALATAHKLGVTHQWLSPRTVLCDDEGAVKLVGIGLREILADSDDTSRAYLSPEVRDGGMVGPASDVYSLGLLAVELLQAQMPARWSELEAVPAADVGWPSAAEAEVSKSVRDLLVRALAHEPLARPSTAELQAALTSVGLVPGQVLDGRYQILGELGRGGMSRVYRARDRQFDEELAIKTLLTPTAGHSEDEERLMREVRISRKITHPNVVRVHDLDRFPGGIFVTMELLDGPSLDRVIKDEAPLAIGRVKKLLAEIAAALAEAHRFKVIHRDLKPSNVMLVDGRVKVLDFGIARMSDGTTSNLTRTGEVIGSPLYMAPEQIQGHSLDGTCDLYSLGVIAYTLLTGREPFLGETPTAIVLKHLHEDPPDVAELRPELPRAWVKLLATLLAKQPEDRYPSAEALLAALAELPD